MAKKEDRSTFANVLLVLGVLIGVSGMWGISIILFFISILINKKGIELLSKETSLSFEGVRILISIFGLVIFGYFTFGRQMTMDQTGAGFIGLVIAIIFMIINLIKYNSTRKKK
jgi:hypothetical protein